MILIPFNLLLAYFRKGLVNDCAKLAADQANLSEKTAINTLKGKKPSKKTVEKFIASDIGKLLVNADDFINIFSIRKHIRRNGWRAFVQGVMHTADSYEPSLYSYLPLKSLQLLNEIAALDDEMERFAPDCQLLRRMIVESDLPFLCTKNINIQSSEYTKEDLAAYVLNRNIDSMVFIFASFSAELSVQAHSSAQLENLEGAGLHKLIFTLAKDISGWFSGRPREHWLLSLKNHIGVRSTNQFAVLYGVANDYDSSNAERELRRFQAAEHTATNKSLDKILQLLDEDDREPYKAFFYIGETIRMLQAFVDFSIQNQLMPEDCDYLTCRFEEYFKLHYGQYSSQKSAVA